MAQNPYASPRAQVRDTDNTEVGVAKFWSFSGRIGRMRYLAYNMAVSLIAILIITVITLIGAGISAAGSEGLGAMVFLLLVPIYIGMIVISFMITIQRVHDFNMSGWLSLLALVGAGIVFMFIPGTVGRNNYGPQPPPNSTGVQVLFWFGVVGLVMLPFIGILAAIAIPAYNGYIEKANEAQYQQDYNQEDLQRKLQELEQQMQQGNQ